AVTAGSDGTDVGTTVTPGAAVAPLTPTGLYLTVAQRASLEIGELTSGSESVRPSSLRQGGTLPDVDADGRIAYLVLDPRLPDAGRVWIASFSSFPSTEVVPDARALESSVRFAPAPQALLVTREALGAATPSATPSPSFRPSP